MKDITFKYYENTKGCFQIISKGLLENLLKTIENLSVGDKFCLGGKQYLLDFKSINDRYESLSIYIINIKTGDLIRISDHWSSGSSLTNCSNIATCRWSLIGSKKTKAVSSCSFIIKNYIDGCVVELPPINKTTTVCGGIINLSKLKHI